MTRMSSHGDRTRRRAPRTAQLVTRGGRSSPRSGPASSQLLGHAFSQVRIYADARSAESARVFGADAYTVGSEIFFRAGRYTPESRAGRALLAHELTHTIQQRAGGPSIGRISTSADAPEQEAADAARAVDAGARFAPRLAAPVHIARQETALQPSLAPVRSRP